MLNLAERKKKKRTDGQTIAIAVLAIIIVMLLGVLVIGLSLGSIGGEGTESDFGSRVRSFFSNITGSTDSYDIFSGLFSGEQVTTVNDYYNIDATRICFFGDSLTYGIDFTSHYPDKTFTNLGVVGDSIGGLTDRVYQVQQCNPEKIFLLVGINCVRSNNVESEYNKYVTLVDTIRSACPNARLYIQSVLPISARQEYEVCPNSTIVYFNSKLQALAQEKGLMYIDLYSQFVYNGVMNPDYTSDGIHLTSSGYDVWELMIRPYIE